MKRKAKSFIVENYKQSFNYILESKKYIYSVVILFFVFTLIGFFVPVPAAISEMIIEFIREMLEKTQGMGILELIVFIFLNNLKVSILGIILGILFGVVPIVLSISNGYLLGFVASIAAKSEGILTLWRIFPHGVFELPAIFISLAIGLRLGFYVFFEKKDSLYNNLIDIIRVFVLILIPLLIVAALIEGFLIFLSR